jgi:diguanylate cyclase (GGDEF)-like protein
MNLRILLVESEVEDVLFLQDVLTEIESGRYWSNWVHVESLHALNTEEAAAILANELVDVILLDLDLADSLGIGTFRAVEAIARQIPIILLVGPDGHASAARMIRDGAQDFLMKKQIDCAPLAHAIRNAIERHRLLTAARASTTTDPLTGLPNRGGFLTLADRDRQLAECLRRRLMVLVVEPDNVSEIVSAQSEQRRDLTIVETADHLRSLARATDLLARIGQTRFALAVFDTDTESVEEAWSRMQAAAPELHIRVGAAIFDPDRPSSLDTLLDQAALDLAPAALSMRR